jgi:hypothetical protein
MQMEYWSSLRDRLFVYKGTVSAVSRAEFVSDRSSYIGVILLFWCAGQTYEELERVSDSFPKKHMNILLGDGCKTQAILKETIWII